MISRLVPNINLYDHDMTGGVSKTQRTPQPGDQILLYISELMSKISNTEGKKQTVQIKGSTIFINDPECKPIIPTKLTSQNYITVTCGKNANWDGIDRITKNGNGDIVKRELPKGLQVQCNFLSGILNHGVVETKRDMREYDTVRGSNTSTIYSGDIRDVYVSDPEQIATLSSHVSDLINKLRSNHILGKK